MKIEKIKPISKRMLALIKRTDKQQYKKQDGYVRYYAYLTSNDGELVKVTVAVKNYYKKWYCKQVAVHGLNSDYCFVKDIVFYYIGGYVVRWYNDGAQRNPKWYEYGEWLFYDKDSMFDPYAPVLNKEYALKYRKYKYSQIEQYRGVEVLKYLRLYDKYPQMEYLMKAELDSLVMNITILRKIGKDKRFAKWLIRNREEISKHSLYTNAILNAYKKGTPPFQENIREEIKIGDRKHRFDTIKQVYGEEWNVLCEYVIKQIANMYSYMDYHQACDYLHIDMSLPKNRYPHDFKRWHDIRIDQYNTAKAVEDAEKRKELYAKFAAVADKYLPMQYEKENELIVLIPHSPQDLVAEGKALDHCVGRMNYDQKFAREETLIFFVRHKEEPQTPFVTVEFSLSSNKILQCYGKGDIPPKRNVMDFVNERWLPYAQRTIQQIAA